MQRINDWLSGWGLPIDTFVIPYVQLMQWENLGRENGKTVRTEPQDTSLLDVTGELHTGNLNTRVIQTTPAS